MNHCASRSGSRIGFSLLFTLTFSCIVVAQGHYRWTNAIDSGHYMLFWLELDTLDAYAKKLPAENGFSLYLIGASLFAHEMVNPSKTSFLEGTENRMANISALREMEASSPFKNFLLAELHLYEMLLQLKYQNRWQAGRHASRARKLLERNIREYPEFHLSYKTLGLLELSLAAAPVSGFAKWVASVSTGIDYDRDKGSDHINRAKQWCIDHKSPFLIHCLLTEIYLHLQILPQYDKALALIESLSTPSKRNILRVYLKAYCLSKMRDCDAVLDLSEKVLYEREPFPIPAMYYLAGKCSVYPGSEEDTEQYLLDYIAMSKGDAFHADAMWKLAIWYLLNGEEERFHFYRMKVIKETEPYLGVDQLAFWEANKIEQINSDLMAVRMLWDTGKDKQALRRLQEMDEPDNYTDQLEYNYRKGRLLSAMGEISQAVEAYKRAMLIPAPEDPYYRCNSALQLGLTYERSGDREEAETYFKQCLNISPDVFGPDLHRQAKAGLERIAE